MLRMPLMRRNERQLQQLLSDIEASIASGDVSEAAQAGNCLNDQLAELSQESMTADSLNEAQARVSSLLARTAALQSNLRGQLREVHRKRQGVAAYTHQQSHLTS